MAGEIFKRDVSAAQPPGGIVSAPLGDDNATGLAQADVGKAVKFQNGTAAAAGTFEAVLCTAGDRIDGWVSSVEPFTVNSGFAFGGVQILGDHEAEVGTTTVAVGDLVQLESQAVLGTAGVPRVVAKAIAALDSTTTITLAADVEAALLTVKKETDWMCTQIVTGDGTVAGDKIILERVL